MPWTCDDATWLDALIQIVVCLGRYGSDSEPDGGGDMSGDTWKGGDSMGGSGLESREVFRRCRRA